MIAYLKVIVIVLGVMIAAGIAVIGIKLAEKSDELAELGREGAAPDPAPDVAMPPPAPADLGLPAGSQVRRMTAADNRLILVVAPPNGGERIVIVDLRNGRTVAIVELEGAP